MEPAGTLSALRSKRDALEAEELALRNEAIREKIIPLMATDIRGELSEADGLTLLELCDDYEIDSETYDQLRGTATAIAYDAAAIAEIEPQLESEKLRFARLAFERRRAQRALELAEKLNRNQHNLRMMVLNSHKQLDEYRERHPFFFDRAGDVLPEVLALPVKRRSTRPAAKQVTCPICGHEHNEPNAGDICSPRCQKILDDHGDILQELELLPPKPKTPKRKKTNA